MYILGIRCSGNERTIFKNAPKCTENFSVKRQINPMVYGIRRLPSHVESPGFDSTDKFVTGEKQSFSTS